ncbi:2-methylcitrate synthase [Ophiocordyceps camponoti-floridani]|uniref:Citrate synthase n=1 Tax=Ophiocordyceps camponoti-floridani TaxID=2030778 RepID=A0A8H4QAI4_9HYPO|nr:2-methylcitrate synthase [Ophiocordyceps camponoti-floridani]
MATTLLRHLPRQTRSSPRCYPLSSIPSRSYSTPKTEPNLKDTLRTLIPAKRAEVAAARKKHGGSNIGEVKVENVLGGMRGLRAMLWEGSVLDPDQGIRFHGRTIKDCQRELPCGTTGSQMAPEAMFWLLLTGQVPTVSQTRQLSNQLAAEAELPSFVTGLMSSMPKDLHPMTLFAMCVAALNRDSKFARAYADGLAKEDYWETTFDDAISLLAKLPTIAATMYKHFYSSDSEPLNVRADPKQDWAFNFAAMLGKGTAEDEGFQDLMRLYLALHADHEGGNVSAHATHLVGSALSDPFLSYSAGLLGLAGPLHGLAAQEVLRWTETMKSSLPKGVEETDMREYIWDWLNQGRVIPGYGHAVLRKPDPRFEALMDFAESQPAMQNDELIALVKTNSRIIPDILRQHGKTKNPFPNVDSASGVLFHHYGLRHTLYYTVTFGVSRGIGPMAQLIWDRALGLPIERPKSVNLAGLVELAEKS